MDENTEIRALHAESPIMDSVDQASEQISRSPMIRLKGQDASFLYNETPTALMHTLKVQIVAPPAEGYDFDMDDIKQKIMAAIEIAPVFRQKVLFVPWGLHHPVLVDDPDFDLDFHICRAALPAPGGRKELDDMLAQIITHRLDRHRPLWELWILTGLDNGAYAIVQKLHHTIADGMAAMHFFTEIFSGQSTARTPTAMPAKPLPAKPPPGKLRLVGDAVLDHFRYDIQNFPAFVRSLWRHLRDLIAFNKRSGSPTIDRISNPPPRLRFNYALSGKRVTATRQISLTEVLTLRKKLSGTVNDIALALVSTALRNYLLHHNELPDEPLGTAVPVSIDGPQSARNWGNKTTSLMTCLWTNVEDPLERFRAVQQSTLAGKEELDILGRETMYQLFHYLPPLLSTLSTQRNFRLRTADGPNYKSYNNLIISNVPGPREPLEGAFGRLLDMYSFGVLLEGCGLNITIWSYADKLSFGVLACKQALPDIERFADGLNDALQELQEVADKLENTEAE